MSTIHEYEPAAEYRKHFYGRKIKSRYAGRCACCWMPYNVGDSIVWQRGGASIHADPDQCIGTPDKRAVIDTEILKALDNANTVTKWQKKTTEWHTVLAAKHRTLASCIGFHRTNGYVGPAHMPIITKFMERYLA